MNIGCPGRPFVTAEPGLNDLLPADDAEWDRGVRLDYDILLCSPLLIKFIDRQPRQPVHIA